MICDFVRTFLWTSPCVKDEQNLSRLKFEKIFQDKKYIRGLKSTTINIDGLAGSMQFYTCCGLRCVLNKTTF